jgi:uncharacterized phiE125 gp8 family phage protein
MSYKIVTGPSVEPLTLTQAKLFLRVDNSDEDDLITAFIVAARQAAEEYLNQKLITHSMECYLDSFSPIMELDLGPVQSITTVKYYDADGDLQTLSSSNYNVDTVSQPARVQIDESVSIPTVDDKINAVIIAYESGYGDTSVKVPSAIISAVMLILGDLYENRQDTIIGSQVNELPKGSKALLDLYTVKRY